MLAEYQAYIAKLRAAGKLVVYYFCPHCEKQIDTQAAPVGVKWDTLSACPHCQGVHFKVTKGPVVTAEKV